MGAAVPASSCATTPPEPQVVSVPLEIKPIAELKANAAIAVAPPSASAAPTPPPSSASMSAGIWALPYDPAAPAKSCSQLRCPGPVHEAMGVLRSNCRSLSEALRPEPFQRFMTCLMAQNNTRNTCDLMLVGTDPGECLEKWSSPPALDPAAATKCIPIVAACAGGKRSVHANAPLTMEACQGLFSVTSAKAERKMVHCAMEYCDGAPELCYMATMY